MARRTIAAGIPLQWLLLALSESLACVDAADSSNHRHRHHGHSSRAEKGRASFLVRHAGEARPGVEEHGEQGRMSCGDGIHLCGLLALESGLGHSNYEHDEPVVHGLWPETDDFGNSECRAPSREEPPVDVFACYNQRGHAHSDLLHFQHHEWSHHGMCSGVVDAADYFSQICGMATAPLSTMKQVRARNGGLQEMRRALEQAGYFVWRHNTHTGELYLAACANEHGRWQLSHPKDFAQRCGVLPSASSPQPLESKVVASPPERSVEQEMRCFPSRKGPPCTGDQDCRDHGGCIRCAHSGHCTGQPLH
eukprot:TRINITY_DN12589_c0_g1_i1.p1 TRINITY_DN12589_c0_g1~~TRINITY_DN12589_c0_g1_i1.p1  ORF type:complete len:345 (-),score=16.57 TRINITY_DN12589_c0_g1_i1:83-1006(-)